MGVTAHKQIETAVCSLAVGMIEKSIVGNFRCRLFNVVDSIVVRIANAG